MVRVEADLGGPCRPAAITSAHIHHHQPDWEGFLHPANPHLKLLKAEKIEFMFKVMMVNESREDAED